MARVRICMVVNNLDVGGLEKMVISLLKGLSRELFKVHLVCLSGRGAMFGEIDLPSEDVLVLEKKQHRTPGLNVSFDARVFWSIRSFFKERQIQIAHAHNLSPLVYGGFAACSLTQTNRPLVVYTEHNQIYSASRGQQRRFPYYARLADEVFVVSRELEETLVKDMGVPAARTRVLYNGIDGQPFAMNSDLLARGQKLRAKLGISKDEIVFGCAAVLSEQKGMRYLLEAVPVVLRQEPRARFVIAGDGPLRAELEQWARLANISERVIFLGYRRDVPELIAAYDAYVSASLWEGLPLALLEALAAGKPIICTAVGGSPEIVTDGENGVVVPSRNSVALAGALVRVARDRALVEQAKVINVHKFNQHFSLTTTLIEHSRAYMEILERRPDLSRPRRGMQSDKTVS